jgi:hypothetical protein
MKLSGDIFSDTCAIPVDPADDPVAIFLTVTAKLRRSPSCAR